MCWCVCLYACAVNRKIVRYMYLLFALNKLFKNSVICYSCIYLSRSSFIKVRKLCFHISMLKKSNHICQLKPFKLAYVVTHLKTKLWLSLSKQKKRFRIIRGMAGQSTLTQSVATLTPLV